MHQATSKFRSLLMGFFLIISVVGCSGGAEDAKSSETAQASPGPPEDSAGMLKNRAKPTKSTPATPNAAPR